jgi:hypothetical protein
VQQTQAGDRKVWLALAFTNTVGFTLGILPPVLLDPLLKSHARFGARHYPMAWMGIPLGIAVFLSTLAVTRFARRGNARFLGVLPLFCGIVLSQPILMPEFPHLNLVSTFFIWGLITSVWIWVDDLDADLLKGSERNRPRPSRELIRDRKSFDRLLMLSFIFGGGILLLAGVIICVYSNGQFLSSASERFMLNGYTFVAYTCFGLFVSLGPVLTLASKARQLDALSGAVDVDPDLRAKVAVLEGIVEGLSQQMQKAIQDQKDDPGNTLNKCRSVCERLVERVYTVEMGEEPRKVELGEMLNNNQFTRRLERRIVSEMQTIRDIGNVGSHGYQVSEVNANVAVQMMLDVIEWYVGRYGADRPGADHPPRAKGDGAEARA